MKASLTPIMDILGAPDTRYLIPVFQRVYSWNRRQCDQLWSDMTEAGARNATHFLGSLIFLPEDEASSAAEAAGTTNAHDAVASPATRIRRVDLIDGQQRLTTITLALVALRNHLRGSGDAARADALDESYLCAPDGLCKLQLSEADAPELEHLVTGAPLPAGVEPSKFLVDNLATFQAKIAASTTEADAVLRGLKSLRVVAIELTTDDAPQQVFESLNAKGRPLSTADLLRNTLLTRYGADEQERLFDVYWAPMDDAFRQFGAEQDIYLDAALHCWAAKAAPSIHAAKRSDLYQAFKGYLMSQKGSSLEDLLKSVSAACLAFAAHPDTPEAKTHLDWAVEKPQGMISQRKLFGD